MLARIIAHIIRTVIRFIGIIILVAILIFFGLTRTQVGRDQVARQIERAFEGRFGGELRIERMTGNLAQTLYASGISVRDPAGHEVLRVDSVVASPRWTGLIRKEFSVRHLVASGVQIAVHADSGMASSSLMEAFRVADTTAQVAPGRGSWSLRDATVSIRDIDVEVGAGEGWIAWLRDHPIADADVNLQVSWRTERRQVDVLDLTASFPEQDVRLREGRMQLLVSDDAYRLTRLAASTDGSDIGLVGSFERGGRGESSMDQPFLLELQPSVLDFDELERFRPGLPVRGSVSIAAMVQGPVSDMTVSWLRLKDEGLDVDITGRVEDLPRAARFEFSVSAPVLQRQAVRDRIADPSLLNGILVESASGSAYVRGAIGPLDAPVDQLLSTAWLSGTVDASSGVQSASFSFDLDGRASGIPTHALQARIQRVDLGRWTGRPALSTSLSGTLGLEGRGLTPEEATTDLTWDLRRVEVNDRSADRTTGTATWSRGVVSTEFAIEQSGGRLEARLDGPVLEADGQIAAVVTLTEADLGPLLGLADNPARLNMNISGQVSNRWNDAFEASIALQTDSAAYSLELHPPGSASPGLVFRAPSMDVSIGSDVSLPALSPILGAWTAAIQAAWHDESDKWLYQAINEDPDRLLELEDALALEWARTTGVSGSLTGEVTVRDADLVNAFLPADAAVSARSRLSWTMTLSADSLRGTVAMRDTDLDVGRHRVHNAYAVASFSADRSGPVSRTVEADVTVSADSMALRDVPFAQPYSRISVRDGLARMGSGATGVGRTDSLVISTTFELRDAFNTVTVSTARLGIGASEWRLESPARMDLFADATRLEPFAVQLHRADESLSTSFRAGGILSANPRDSLQVGVRDIVFTDLSEFLGIRKRIGGLLNGDLVLKGGYRQPQVSGLMTLERASIERHIVGDLTLESRFVPGSPDVAVDLRIDPLRVDSARIVGRDEDGIVVDNELRFSGNVRLPGSDPSDRGRLDLDVALERVDLFFFEYIFTDALTNVSGHGEGDGRVTGTFSQPVFSADAGILGGRFTVPSTRISYTLDGDIRIDRDAIHINTADLTDGTGGTGTISGRLNFNEYREFTLDLAGRLSNVQIIGTDDASRLPFYGYIWASGSFTLTGPLYDALLRSTNAVTRPDSRLFIPIEEELSETDESFIVFEDSVGVIPDFRQLARRPFLLARRPTAERQFLDALNMDLNIEAPPGSVVSLVIDPLLGDVITAVSSGTIQLVRQNGEFFTYGQLEVTSGDYLFTAGEVFQRKFFLENGGTMTWGGDPLNAELDLDASYRTRASLAGLSGAVDNSGLVPLIVQLHITGTVTSPAVELGLAIDRSNQNVLGDYQALEAQLNQPDRATEYATSVLLTNSFQLTTENITTDSGGQLAFNSVSQLVSAQLNRFLNAALPNVEFSFGLLGENAQDLDVTYGVAWRMLDERLIIRGEGVYQGAGATDNVRANDGLQGEFVVEVRLGPRVSVEVFFRREGDILQGTELTNTGGVGVSYQTDFTRWRHVFSSRRGS